jgi:splicing factor, arginine/serine-rich 4/5/6
MTRTVVYIGGIHYRADERDVKHLFRPYGKIVDIDLKKGFGFVEFEDRRDAEDACKELNGIYFIGRR